jgi:hypothetical protein
MVDVEHKKKKRLFFEILYLAINQIELRLSNMNFRSFK